MNKEQYEDLLEEIAGKKKNLDELIKSDIKLKGLKIPTTLLSDVIGNNQPHILGTNRVNEAIIIFVDSEGGLFTIHGEKIVENNVEKIEVTSYRVITINDEVRNMLQYLINLSRQSNGNNQQRQHTPNKEINLDYLQ